MDKSYGDIFKEMITMPNVQWPRSMASHLSNIIYDCSFNYFRIYFGLILGVLLFLSAKVILKVLESFIASFHLLLTYSERFHLSF